MTTLRAAGPGGLNLMSASEAAAGLARRDFSSVELVTDCLARIEARDSELHAWAYLDPEYALAQARACDASEGPKGPLHGIPVGVKDVLDTQDMPTAYGFGPYRDNRPDADSACVAALRAAGAVLLGKTATTEFASPIPIGVRNPHDLDRTPGVSSSGSAAAVADFMVPLSNGTQTGGSVILPATFCGIVGFKASLDGLGRAGIRGLKPSLDTLGLFARTVADIFLFQGALTEAGFVPEPGRPRIGLCRTTHWHEAEPCSQQAVERAAADLSAAGYRVEDVELPTAFDGIEDAFRVISNYEGKEAMAEDFRLHLDGMNGWMRETAKSEWSREDYEKALGQAAAARRALAGVFDDFPLLLTPATAGEAPADLTSVSVSSFNRLWTLMHGPTITLPAGTGPNGMPVGIQLATRPGRDGALISAAGPIAEIVGTHSGP